MAAAGSDPGLRCERGTAPARRRLGRSTGARARSTVEQRRALCAAGTVERTPSARAVPSSSRRIREAMGAGPAAGGVPNFAEGREDLAQGTPSLDPDVPGLCAVRARVDPSGVFAAGHAIPSAA